MLYSDWVMRGLGLGFITGVVLALSSLSYSENCPRWLSDFIDGYTDERNDG